MAGRSDPTPDPVVLPDFATEPHPRPGHTDVPVPSPGGHALPVDAPPPEPAAAPKGDGFKADPSARPTRPAEPRTGG